MFQKNSKGETTHEKRLQMHLITAKGMKGPGQAAIH